MTAYEHKTMRYRTDHRKVKRLLGDGWEIVSHHPGILGSAPTTVLRRPKPVAVEKPSKAPHPNSIAARLERRRSEKKNIKEEQHG